MKKYRSKVSPFGCSILSSTDQRDFCYNTVEMKKLLILGLVSIIYFVLFVSIVLPKSGAVASYSSVPDSDADYLVSLRVFQGKGLYSSFSILYPPGRFLLQGLLFHVWEPSFAVIFGSHALFTFVLFPLALLWVTFYFFDLILSIFKVREVVKIFFSLSSSLLALVIYLDFFRSAQEVHVLSGILLLLLLIWRKVSRWKMFLLGALFGLVMLFRVDTGIVVLIAVCSILVPVVIGYFSRNSSYSESESARSLKKHRLLALQFNEKEMLYAKLIGFSVLGFASIWFPVIFATLFNGSLFNLFYDTIVLGLLIQPKFMGLPIPQNELWLVWLATLIFITANGIAIMVDSKKCESIVQRFGLQLFAVIAVLSYVAALGRADEPHLWYGLVWFPVLICYSIVRSVIGLLRKEKFSFITFFSIAMLIYFYSLVIIKVKSPILFLVSLPILLLGCKRFFNSVPAIVVAGGVTTLLVFHSISYLKLKFTPVSLPSAHGYSYTYVSSEENEIGGQSLVAEDQTMIEQIREDIPDNEEYLFIFPKNVLLGEYLKLKNPTRYIILMNERSDYTEREVIDQLEKTNTQYILNFPTQSELREGLVWEWIQKETIVIKEYQFSEEKAELRKRN